MDTLKQKLASRRFLFALGAVLTLVGTFLQDKIDATAFVTGLVGAIGLYQTSEAVVDAARAQS